MKVAADMDLRESLDEHTSILSGIENNESR